MNVPSSQMKYAIRVRTAQKTLFFAIGSHGLLIGRDETADIRIDVFEISRKHAKLTLVDGQVFIQDLKSANGTFFGGRRLNLDEKIRMKKGQELSLGDVAWVSVVEKDLELKPEPRVAKKRVVPKLPTARAKPEAITVAQSEPTAIPTAEPIVIAKAEPVVVAKAKPVVVAKAEPVVIAKVEPIVIVKTVPVESSCEKEHVSSILSKMDLIQEDALRFAENLKEETRQETAKLREETRIEVERLKEEARREADTLQERARLECDTSLSEKKQEVDRLAIQEVGLQENVSELEKRVSGLRSEVSEWETKVAELNACSRTLEIAFAETQSNQSKTESVLKSLEKLLGETKQAMADTEKRMESVALRAEGLNSENLVKEKRIAALQDEIKKLQEQSQSKRDELKTIQLSIDRESQALEAEKRTQSAFLATAQAEFRTKKLGIEASVAEAELQKIEANRLLQVVLNERSEAERDLAKKKTEFEHHLSLDRELQNRMTSGQQTLAEIETSIQDLRKKEALARADLDGVRENGKKLNEGLLKQRDSEIAQIGADLSQRRAALEEEFLRRGAEMERNLNETKKKELEKISQIEQETRLSEKSRRNHILDELVRCAMKLVQENSLDEDRFKKVARSILEGKSVGALSAEGAKRSKDFWRKVSIGAAAPLAVILFFVLVPGLPHSVEEKLTRAIASETKKSGGVFLDEIRERGLSYQPEMNRSYRDTYSDNILYLDGYLEMKLNEEEKKKWTLLLNDFIVGRLGLSDQKIPDVISSESVMIQDLAKIRRTILPQFKDQGMDRLNAEEKLGVSTLVSLLQSDENYKKFRAFEKSYYEDYMSHKQAEKPLEAGK